MSNSCCCGNCDKFIEGLSDFEIRVPVLNYTELICSASCLVEWAWKQKEMQIKMSKSKEA